MAEDGPLVVVWRVTTACGLACPFCRHSREVRFARRHADPALVLAFGAALGDWTRRRLRPVHVSWLGGEPLLWPHLEEVSRCFRLEHGLSLGLTTGGDHLDDSLLVWMAGCLDRLTLSVDGPPELHDRLRGQAGLTARLERAVRQLRELRARLGRGPRLAVNTVLMRSNLAGFPELCFTLAGWGVEEITFNLLGGLERGGLFYERERVPPEDLARLRECLPELGARLAERGLTLSGGRAYLEHLEAQAGGQPWPVTDCKPGRNFLFVDEIGRVGPCSYTLDEHGLPLAELRAPADLDRLPGALRARRAQRPAAACADCRCTQVLGKFAVDLDPRGPPQPLGYPR